MVLMGIDAGREWEIEQYRQLVYEIKNDLEIKSFPRLEPYRKNIRLVFNFFKITDDLFDPNKYSYDKRNKLAKLIVKIIVLAEALENKRINIKTITALKVASEAIDSNDVLEHLKVFYVPEKVIDYSITTYLRTMSFILFDSCGYWAHRRIDTGDEMLDELYKWLSNIFTEDYEFYLRVTWGEYTSLLTLILSCVHIKNCFSKELFYDYIKNLDQYLDKMNLMGINGNDLDNVTIEQFNYIFNNFDSIFQVNNVTIR